MAVIRPFVQAPTDRIYYDIDWSAWLQDGDTVQTSEWDASEEGITRLSDAPYNPDIIQDGTWTRIWLTGGEDATTYRITNLITTMNGLKASQSFYVRVRVPK